MTMSDEVALAKRALAQNTLLIVEVIIDLLMH